MKLLVVIIFRLRLLFSVEARDIMMKIHLKLDMEEVMTKALCVSLKHMLSFPS